MEKIRVSIVGATGYSGKELIRILLKHPQVELTHLVSASYVGQNIAAIFPEFKNQLDKELISLDLELITNDSELIFTALPHTVSLEVVPDLLARKKRRVIDLSADFRLRSADNYTCWYQKEHTEKSRILLKEAVYGLPELYKKEIKNASLVANPGCYPTSVLLGIAPLLAYHLVEAKDIIIDSKSGTSGAGRKLSLDLHFTECHDNFKAYKCLKHNHIPEMEQELSFFYNLYNRSDSSDRNDSHRDLKPGKYEEIKISFTPHLLPLSRGILSTCYLTLIDNYEEDKIVELYHQFYQEAPFIRIFNPPALPEIRFVSQTNYCDIGFAIDRRVGKIKIISVLDNLTKGAAGQAVQNMNIMFNFPEELGLI
ncbi:MAG: N-acetyl-gamma-glutamyl-phosphate reductase [Candidatus Atribacteria bacterium]|nr:N-acetyl-gamma-glutamyl-phosphate reductase [Candidatus Atribacteria bacterium]